MSAIVAFLHCFQDVGRIVRFKIVVAFDDTFLVSFRRFVHLLVWTLRRVDQGRPVALVRSYARVGVVALHIFLVGGPGSKGACGLEQP